MIVRWTLSRRFTIACSLGLAWEWSRSRSRSRLSVRLCVCTAHHVTSSACMIEIGDVSEPGNRSNDHAVSAFAFADRAVQWDY
ncbi:hypothetical protein GGR58DRAFT_453648 [Xylaria digitata]|nr:hypothetical protein GGR58DRAFT_453648 [Xylaria digitata]